MQRRNLDDLSAFLIVAREGSFTRAAAKLGISQSALSYTIKALAGLGLTYLPEGLVQPHISKGRLRRVLEDWCPSYPGYHLYYPSRRQPSAAFALLVEALRYRK
jgi:DNA-binding transcriptional LysR family regulator